MARPPKSTLPTPLMKSLFVTLIIFGAAFLAYDYFGAPPGEKMVFKSLNGLPSPAPEAVVPVATEPKAPVAPVKPVAPVAQAVAAVPAASPPAPTLAAGADHTGFVAPKFDSLDVLSKNWTFIPKIAFPRQVKLTRNTQFKMSAGAATMNAGAEVTALGFDNGQLVLAPNEASAARASAAIDDTDLKAVLAAGYEQWKIARTAIARRTFLAKAARVDAPAVTDPSVVDPAGKPVRGSDGSFPALVNSLKSGEITEIKLANIHHWADPEPTMLEGKPAWSIKVQADVDTVFGLQPAEAQALVRDGRVKGWYYTGSGEPVP
jgi:hypothetical protein